MFKQKFVQFYAQNELISNLMPATGLKIVGTGAFLIWCSISSPFQNSLKNNNKIKKNSPTCFALSAKWLNVIFCWCFSALAQTWIISLTNSTFIVMHYLNTRIYIKLMFYECQDLLLGNSRSWHFGFANDLTSLAIYDLSWGGTEWEGCREIE